MLCPGVGYNIGINTTKTEEMNKEKEKLNRLLFWACWSGFLITGIVLLNPFWTVAFVAVWILFGIFVYWADTCPEVEDENLNHDDDRRL